MGGPHPVLFLPEIFLEILEELSTKELVVVALVCKAWVSLAQDAMWRTMRINLSLLLAKLAPFVDVAEGVNYYRRLALEYEQINQERWTLFLNKYASKVTHIYVDVGLDPPTLDLITRLINNFGGPLCAKLSVLDAGTVPDLDPSETYSHLIALLLGKKVRSITLSSTREEHALEPLFSVLAQYESQISSMSAFRVPCSYAPFTGLRSLTHFGYISCDNYVSLTACLGLQTLSIAESRHWNQPPDNLSLTFPSLNNISLIRNDVYIEALVRQSFMPALRSFRLRRRREPRNEPPLILHILQTCPLLRSLKCDGKLPREVWETMRHVGVTEVNLMYPDIAPYGVNLRSGVEVDGNDLEWVGLALPNVEVLVARQHYLVEKWPTWRVLPSVARQCDHLRRLETCIRVPELSPPGIDGARPFPSLFELSIPKLYIEEKDMEPFIGYLVALCPHVKTLRIDKLFHPPPDDALDMEDYWPQPSAPQEAVDSFVNKFFERRRSCQTLQCVGGNEKEA
ncbi:hypothetical protein FRB95_011081 [Tulasnella sp. JGI-2019a]|nr:hypothetical protein FRB95_011081 [Tulasnella sp. JGI-2019a]